jgi:putative membrane protein
MTNAGAAGTSGSAGAGGGPTDMTAFMSTFATMPDATFLLTAASSNLLELQAGQMAAQKATSASVKKFAQMMVDHHTKATQQLTAIATPLGVSPSQTLMPVHQAMLDQLTAKSGKQFDESYMDAMETAHTMDIAMFEVKDKAAETPTVKAFATKTLPMLRSHRKMAGELESKVD